MRRSPDGDEQIMDGLWMTGSGKERRNTAGAMKSDRDSKASTTRRLDCDNPRDAALYSTPNGTERGRMTTPNRCICETAGTDPGDFIHIRHSGRIYDGYERTWANPYERRFGLRLRISLQSQGSKTKEKFIKARANTIPKAVKAPSKLNTIALIKIIIKENINEPIPITKK